MRQESSPLLPEFAKFFPHQGSYLWKFAFPEHLFHPGPNNGGQSGVPSPSLIHIGSFFLVMLPACYWLGIVEGRGAQGMMEGVFIGVFTAGIMQTMLLEWKTARQPSRRAV